MKYVRNTYCGNTLHPTAVKSFSSHAPILNRQKRNATKANSWPANIKAMTNFRQITNGINLTVKLNKYLYKKMALLPYIFPISASGHAHP